MVSLAGCSQSSQPWTSENLIRSNGETAWQHIVTIYHSNIANVANMVCYNMIAMNYNILYYAMLYFTVLYCIISTTPHHHRIYYSKQYSNLSQQDVLRFRSVGRWRLFRVLKSRPLEHDVIPQVRTSRCLSPSAGSRMTEERSPAIGDYMEFWSGPDMSCIV